MAAELTQGGHSVQLQFEVLGFELLPSYASLFTRVFFSPDLFFFSFSFFSWRGCVSLAGTGTANLGLRSGE
jgi:hypothetical protein